jgi:hypothetical protein
MNMQMECTGIDECEYVEFRFKQLYYAEWEISKLKKGFFTVSPDGVVVYDAYQEHEDAQTIYWVLNSLKEDFMSADPNWLPSKIDVLKATWDEILQHRANKTIPTNPKTAIVSMDI